MLHGELVILLKKHFTVGASDDIMSGPSKGLWLLTHSEISRLIVDTDSDEVRVSSDVISVEGGSISVPQFSQPQPYHQAASCHKSSSSISSSASDEEDASENGSGNGHTPLASRVV